MINISSQFDGGNIEVISCDQANDIVLEIKPDHQSEFYQWFYFRVTGATGQTCRMHIRNAGGAAFIDGFKEYSAVASYDREHWFRIDTTFDGSELVIEWQPESDSAYIAYFAPYSMERHADLISWALQHDGVGYERLGATLDGQDMDLLTISRNTEAKYACWIIARQHPGETMAEWCMEGFLGRLLDDADPVSREILSMANVYLVPNMNPDGSRRGHLRTNAVGSNLNREWQSPSLEKSPEVLHVLNKMREVGVDFCLDMHGDEGLPYNFIAGAEGVPSWTPERQEALDFYKHKLMEINPDFQVAKGYPEDAPGQANLTICTNYIAEAFGCLAMTLEMPFKDTVESPEPICGWSGERSKAMGAANVQALHAYLKRQSKR